MEEIKKTIEQWLKITNRKGINKLLKYMEESGFYFAPASSKFHGASEGMLAEHSLNVMIYALDLAKAWLSEGEAMRMRDSIIISALLHDLGKAGQFNKPLYVENMLKKGRSEAQPYKKNTDLMTLDHEIVSVIEASKYIELTEDEQLAIAWHNGLYGNFKYEIQGKETPLYMIIHFADLWASRVVEKEKEDEGSRTEKDTQ